MVRMFVPGKATLFCSSPVLRLKANTISRLLFHVSFCSLSIKLLPLWKKKMFFLRKDYPDQFFNMIILETKLCTRFCFQGSTLPWPCLLCRILRVGYEVKWSGTQNPVFVTSNLDRIWIVFS